MVFSPIMPASCNIVRSETPSVPPESQISLRTKYGSAQAIVVYPTTMRTPPRRADAVGARRRMSARSAFVSTMSLVVSNHNVTADDAGIPLRRVPIKKPLDAFHDVCRDFILREMTDAIEFEEARARELALPAGEMRRADESIRKAPYDERGDFAQCAESCADGIECRIAGHDAPRERPRPFARRAVRE
jgi:hypothetical protein